MYICSTALYARYGPMSASFLKVSIYLSVSCWVQVWNDRPLACIWTPLVLVETLGQNSTIAEQKASVEGDNLDLDQYSQYADSNNSLYFIIASWHSTLFVKTMNISLSFSSKVSEPERNWTITWWLVKYMWSRNRVTQSRVELLWSRRELTTKMGNNLGLSSCAVPWSAVVYVVAYFRRTKLLPRVQERSGIDW